MAAKLRLKKPETQHYSLDTDKIRRERLGVFSPRVKNRGIIDAMKKEEEMERFSTKKVIIKKPSANQAETVKL